MKTQLDCIGTDFDTSSNERNELMTPPTSPARPRPFQAALGFTLALGLIAGNLMAPLLAGAATPASHAWPVRNFLPPIASINPKLIEQQATSTDNELTPVALSAVSGAVIRTTPKVSRLATAMDVATKNEGTQALMEIQKKVSEADLEHLWRATVEKNPVIRFSLEKLATPADLQTKQSSKFLTKSLSLLISGATMGATMLPGASAYQNMGAMSIGNMLQNLTTGNTKPTPNSLSSTEQIQLSELIDELKLRLIQNYQDYKTTLQALADARELTMKNNNLYSKALSSKNDLAVMAAGSSYYQALMHETTLRQKAKLYRLKLERIAGTEAVATLELSPHVSLDSKPANTSSINDIGPAAELKTSAAVMPTTNAVSNADTTLLPQAMEIGPHADNELIGPPLPVLSSNEGHSVKTRRAMVKNISSDSQPQPIPDKIMEHAASQALSQQEKPQP